MREIIKSRENKRAESPKSLAQGNALCDELHPSPSSPERAKSFVNNRLRPEQGSIAHFQFSIFNFQFLILTCHPYGILLTANIFSTDISSLCLCHLAFYKILHLQNFVNDWNRDKWHKSDHDILAVESAKWRYLRDFLIATTKINAGIACLEKIV